ncbi:MAG: GNAT family N-acetyltransferase [Myxococcota bacterium]
MNAPLATPLRPPPDAPAHASSIARVPREVWQAPHVFTSPEYLSALEAFAGDARFHYALRRSSDGVTGGAVFRTFDLRVAEHLPLLATDFAGTSTLPVRWRPFFASLLERFRLRVVLCGNVFSAGPHGHWGSQGAGFNRWLGEEARRVARDVAEPGVRVLVILKDVATCASDTPGDDFAAFSEDPAMALSLHPAWADLEDYARALRSGYRREFHRVRTRGAALVREEFSARDILASAPRIDALHGAVLARARVLPARKSAHLFARLKDALGPRFSLVAYRHRGRLVAFNTRYDCGDELESHYFGVDPEVSETLALYKNLLFDDIAEAIARGRRRVMFGRDAQEVKSALGAQPVPYVSFVWTDSRLSTALLAAVARRLSRVRWTPRRPFRAVRESPRAPQSG